MDPQLVKLTAQIAKIIDSMPAEEGIAAQKARNSASPQKMKLLYLLGVLFDLIQGADGKEGKKGDTGPQGEAGKDGVDGKDGDQGVPGLDGKDGVDGKDGKPGAKGPKGEKGATGLQGPAGKDGIDGKDGEPVTPEMLQIVTTPIIVQNVQKAVSSKTITVDDVQSLYTYKEVTANYEVESNDNLVACVGTFTVTLPTAVGFKREYVIKNTGDGVITIMLTGNQTIDGATTFYLIADEVINLRSTNRDWLII